VASERDSLTDATCPPHYWLIEKIAIRTYHWRCHRCGAQRDQQTEPTSGQSWLDRQRKR
jgi:hypothetical protein